MWDSMVTLEKPTTISVDDYNIMGEMPREILRRENYLMIGKAANDADSMAQYGKGQSHRIKTVVASVQIYLNKIILECFTIRQNIW